MPDRFPSAPLPRRAAGRPGLPAYCPVGDPEFMPVPRTKAERIILALAALDVPGGKITQDQGNDIAELLRGDFELFMELDERPGRYDPNYANGEWHWKLRQARNGCAAFFDILADRKAA